MTTKNRPLIRWAGSKTRILHLLTEHSPPIYGKYIEPFCGSMSLFLRICPEKSAMGDINEELINFYRQVKKHPEEISEAIHKIPRTKEEYYRIRSEGALSSDELGKAIRFFFLNRHCFNGVYRTNKSGIFNVPFGSKLTEIPSHEEIMSFSKKIANTDFYSGDFEVTISTAEQNDFIYLDPPYAGTESRDRGEYGLNSFKEFDIARLSRELKLASDKGVKILLSYASIEVIKKEFSDWNIREISVDRSISGFARGRKKVPEVIITNY
ncbi:DNA adenine methylase [Pseudomonas chlororaphis]|uniref:DNA adenine methylase n=1 Tax=Pseudomonas chlororaphis TaxID=587753 RepID=UPI0009B6F5CD|nr:Dam family site-specific DNA-(adenine-N6)-methyltransferase [Pseudomonas chlororaphis]